MNRDEEFEKIRLALSQFEGVEVITGKELCQRLWRQWKRKIAARFKR